MRTLVFPLIVALISPLALASGPGYVLVGDPALDQYLSPRILVDAPVACSDARTDLLAFEAAWDEETLIFIATVRDAGSRSITCEGESFPRGRAMFSGGLFAIAPPCGDILCGEATGESVEIMLADPMDASGCAAISFPEGLWSDCVGTTVVEGNTLTWTLPLAGSVAVNNGDLRAYDLRGQDMEGGLSSVSWTETPLSPISLRDQVELGALTL